MTTATSRYPINKPPDEHRARSTAQTTNVQFDPETALDV